MTKHEFLEALKCALSSFPPSETDKLLSYCAESIDDRVEDGMDEKTAVESLGGIEKIVKSAQEALPLGVLVKNRIKKSKEKSKNKTLWMVLAICGFPFWLPVLAALFAVGLAVYTVIWAAIVVLYAMLGALGITAACGLVVGVIRCFSADPAAGFMLIGLALVCAGLCVLCFRPVVFLTKKLIGLTVWLGRKIKGLFVSKKEVE